MKHNGLSGLSGVFCVFTLVFFAWGASCEAAVPATVKPAPQKDISTKDLNLFFSKVIAHLKSDYVEDVTNRELLEGALSGMVSSLDPHSSFLTRKQYEEMRHQATGQFGGLGLEIMMEKELIRVISPLEDTPAFKAGLKPGDHIVAIDGVPVSHMTALASLKALRGDPGSKVSLTIYRDQQSPFDVSLIREFIKVQAVKFRQEQDVGYIRITTFNDTTTTELSKAIRTLMTDMGSNLKGFVLDLRNNPGGLLDQAVSVTSLFLPAGRNIVSIKGKENKQYASFHSQSSDMTNGLPLVVLVNGGSASASEIFAGALQDYKRAVIVGTKTFGKGSVQRISPLKAIGALKMTIALYYTPLGRSIQKDGILPDIPVDQQLDLYTITADERLREVFLKDALNHEGMGKHKDVAPEKQEQTKPRFSAHPDYQLTQSLNILRALRLGFTP